MIVTLLVAAVLALVWTVLASLADASGQRLPRDPTTLELLIMAVMTLAVYAWVKRNRAVHRESATDSPMLSELELSERSGDLREDAAEHAA